ncbi:MAG: hypothetical protein U1F43_09545 [Myxococcota bacterium]
MQRGEPVVAEATRGGDVAVEGAAQHAEVARRRRDEEVVALAFDKQLDDRRAAPVGQRQVERRLPLGVDGARVGARRQQRGHEGHVAGRRGGVQQRAARVARVAAEAALEEQRAHDGVAAAEGGAEEIERRRRPAVEEQAAAASPRRRTALASARPSASARAAEGRRGAGP